MRLDAVQLLCEHHKTTAAVRASHLRLVGLFIQFNMDCQSSGFRQVLVAQLRKVCGIYDASSQWREVVQKDCQACNLNREDAVDRGRWKKLIKIG